MATEVIQNPCVFKPKCKSCKAVELVDRPVLCEAMKCPEYSPCVKCGRNVPLTTGKKCTACASGKGSATAAAMEELSAASVPDFPQENRYDTRQPPQPSSEQVIFEPRKYSITVPGQAPPEYNDEEKSYYLKQWKEYEGYYRDPSAYPICHAVILAEIELNHVNTTMINSRYEEDSDAKTKAIDQRQTRLIDAIAKLRGQLPEKEAMEFSEEEKAIAAVYDRWTMEKQKRRVGNISRVISPEAIALAPCLHFPVGLADILSRMGYSTASIERALSQTVPASELPKDPRILLEALGIITKENVVSLDAIGGNHQGADSRSYEREDSTDFKPPSPFDFPQENDGQQE